MKEREGRNLPDFLAAGINRSDPVIQAVFSNDEGEGAPANGIEGVAAFIDCYSRTPDIRRPLRELPWDDSETVCTGKAPDMKRL
jgi:hypothetical protein